MATVSDSMNRWGAPPARRWIGWSLGPALLLAVAQAGWAGEPSTFLGGVVWSDIDHDGIRDPGEPLVRFSAVWLLTSTGLPLYGTITQNNGHYTIEVPGPGSYRLRFLPECYVLTTQDQGSDDFLDSDASPSTGETGLVSTPFTEDDLTRWSAGLVGANGVNPPDQPLFIFGARPDPPPGSRWIFDIEDPNDPASVTSYTMYRSTNAALPFDQWFQSSYDQWDEDQTTPGVQISDLSVPSAGQVYFFQVVAYNSLCFIEGPR